MGLNNINSKSTWGQAASDINTNFTTIDSDLKKVKNATTRNKGYFSTSSELKSAFPTASKGDIAYVGSSYPYDIWKWNGSSWTESGSTGGEESVNLGDYYTKSDINGKFTNQDEKLSELASEAREIGVKRVQIIEYSSAAPNGQKKFSANIKKGVRYIATVKYDVAVSTLQLGTSNGSGYVDSTDVFSKLSEYTYDFIASEDASSFVVYSIGGSTIDFNLVEVVSASDRLFELENKSVETDENVENLLSESLKEKYDYTFAYTPNDVPKISQKEDKSYSVTFVASTYYIIHYGFGSVANFTLSSAANYTVEIGQMLAYNIANNNLEVVSAVVNDETKRIVLLRNYGVVIGEFESIIANEAYNQSVSNKKDIGEKKMDYTFAYNSSNIPTITKKEDESYDVVFKPSTYYIIHYGFGSINNLKLESETTYNIEVGQMLAYNIKNNVIEVVSASINDGTKRIVLLRNYKLVIGEFESIIVRDVNEKVIANKKEIESLKDEVYLKNLLVEYSSEAPSGQRKFSVDIKKGVRYIATVSYDVAVSTLQMGSSNGSGYIDSTPVLSKVSEYTFDFVATENANSFVVYSLGGSTMDFTIFEIVGVKEINDKVDNLNRISVASEEYFQVSCNAEKSISDESFIKSVDGSYILPTTKIYKDWCHFVMPDTDAPLKLVILCHGSGLTVKENVDQWFNYQNIGKILISMGYAVLCCNFMPIDVGQDFYGSPLGNWMIPQIAKSAYDYVMKKYNLDTNGCFIYGQSNGGLTAENIVELTDIPVNAYALEVPNLSFQWGQMLVNPNPMRLFYGMSTSATKPSAYEADKCIGLDPFTRNMYPPLIMSGDTLEEVNAFNWESVQSCKFRKNIPILIQQSLYDEIVSHAMISAYAKAIQNGGGYIKVITYDDPTVRHHIAEQTSKVGTIGIYNVRAAMYNNLAFFSDFGGERIEKIILT